jgi:serine/threonine protein kinase/formylglycine-generating enzyme required for sulfatase activity
MAERPFRPSLARERGTLGHVVRGCSFEPRCASTVQSISRGEESFVMAAGPGGLLASGTIFGGDFRVVRLLGAGGMGEVYVVEQLSTGRERALKVMNPQLAPNEEQRGRFQLEARVGARIASDHVVEVIAAGFDEPTGAPYLVMELLEGETLEERLDRAGPLPAAELASVFDQLGHGLGAAHHAGIVHRDLKPANIFLSRPRIKSPNPVVKVLDFGVAKLVGGTHATQTRQVGTPTYMAPEQCRADPITTATDVWALGLIAFKLLTGKTYWLSVHKSESTPLAIMFEIGYEPLARASERAAALGCEAPLPPGFDAWFARCVARAPGERYPEAGVASAALVALLEGREVPPSLPPSNPFSAPMPDAEAPPTVGERAPEVSGASGASGTSDDTGARGRPPSGDAPTLAASAPAFARTAQTESEGGPIGGDRVAPRGPERTLASVAPLHAPTSPQLPAASRAPRLAVGALALLATLAAAGTAATLRLRAATSASLHLAVLPPTYCPDDMAFLPAGTFRRAASGKATVGAYCMERLEVSIAAYDACVTAGACAPSKSAVSVHGFKADETGWRSLFCPGNRLAGGSTHPVTCIDTHMAQAYCAWKKRRLPTDVEFEWAARGGSKATSYPWGVRAPDSSHACTSLQEARGWSASFGAWEAWSRTPAAAKAGSCEVGSHPKGASPAGVQDLLGNVWDMVTVNLDGEVGYQTAGGGWNTSKSSYIHAGGFWSNGWSADDLDADTGFRCVGNPQ